MVTTMYSTIRALVIAFLLVLSVPPAAMRQAQPGMPPTDEVTFSLTPTC